MRRKRRKGGRKGDVDPSIKSRGWYAELQVVFRKPLVGGKKGGRGRGGEKHDKKLLLIELLAKKKKEGRRAEVRSLCI